MKILQVFRPVEGGLRQHLLTLTKALPEHQITPVLCGPVNGLFDQEKPGPGIKWVDICVRDGLQLPDDFKALRDLAQVMAREEPDLVHAHGYKAALLTDGATRLTRYPWICTLHNYRTWNRGTGLTESVCKTLVKSVLQRARSIICVSQALTDELLSMGISPEKVHVSYNGISVEKFHTQSLKTNTEEPISDKSMADKQLVTCVARLAPDKGVEHFLQAIFSLCYSYASLMDHLNLHFIIVGDGPYRREYEQLAWKKQIASKVTFLGHREDIHKILKRSLVLCIPSRYEGLSITALEGMASLCPIIATNTGGLREVIVDGETGLLVPKDNPEEMARDIILLAKSKFLRRRLIFKAYQRLLDQYTDSRMLQRTLELYREVP